MIDGFPNGVPIDLLAAYAAPLPVTIIAEMLGVPVEMGPQLLDWSHRMVAMYMHGRTSETEAPPTAQRGNSPISCAATSPSGARSPATTSCPC